MKIQFRQRVNRMLGTICVLGSLVLLAAATPKSAAEAQAYPGMQLHSNLVNARGLTADLIGYAFEQGSGNFVGFYLNNLTAGLGTIHAHYAYYVWAGTFLRGDPNHMYVLDIDLNQLSRVDIATGAFTRVGDSIPITGEAWSGLSASPDGTKLYASSTKLRCDSEAGGQSSLYTIDPVNATATRIGPVSSARCLWYIAASPRGTIYGVDVGLDTGITKDENHLVTIDPGTGNGTDTGVLDFSIDIPGGLAFDRKSGVLYLATALETDFKGHLLTINNFYSGSPSLTDVGTFPTGPKIMGMALPIGDDNWGGPPDKIGPLNGAAGVTTHPTLSWQLTGTSDLYDFCLTTTPTTSGETCDKGWKSEATSTSVQPSAVTVGKTYYWQVRSTHAGENTYADGGAWWSFTTAGYTVFLPSVRK